MLQYRKILERHGEGVSIRGIASSTGHSRQKITEIIRRAEDKGLGIPLSDEMTDDWIEGLLFPEMQSEAKGRHIPDFDYIHKELAKPNVTLSLLHHEYELECRANNRIPYAYRTFCQHYNEYARKYKATLRIKRKPGEILEVDWAGTASHIYDRHTGEKVKSYVFVATLPCSQLSYAEAFLSMDSTSWITAHNHAFEYIGGVTELLTPDNLKTGVTKREEYGVILNRSYSELADHYGTIIIPARVRTPRDKANVEGTVGVISTWIIAALRNFRCFTIDELNDEIQEKLEDFNNRKFTKKEGSRRSAFEQEEKFALKPLPPTPYKLSVWKTAQVQLNYHVSAESMFYSVPYEYIQQKVDIRVTEHFVEIYYNHLRIASHKRLHGQFGQYATLREHMPDNHKLYVDHTPESALEWGKTIGAAAEKVVNYILDSYQSEKMALKSIMSLQSLGRKYSSEEMEAACEMALSYASVPTVKGIGTILKSNRKKKAESDLRSDIVKDEQAFGFTRGASYFGGKKNDE